MGGGMENNMKKIILIVIYAALAIGLIAGASLIYNKYMEENKPSNIVIVGGENRPPRPGADEGQQTLSTVTDTMPLETDRDEETASEEILGGTTSEIVADTESEPISETEDVDASESEGGGVIETETPVEIETEMVTEPGHYHETETETETEYVSPYLAPDFTVYDIDGNPVKLSDYRGKPIVLNFWASDCYYCVQEMPDFQKAYEQYGDKVVFLMVCHVGFANRSPSHEKSFIDKNGYTFPVYFDTHHDAVYSYGISGIPQTYFIDRYFDLYTYIPGMADYESLEYCIDLILK